MPYEEEDDLGKILKAEYEKNGAPDLGEILEKGRNGNGLEGFFDTVTSFFSGKKALPGAAGGAVSYLKKAQTYAETIGIGTAIDKELAVMQNVKTTLRDYGYQMDEILSQAVPRLYKMKNSQADLLANRLSVNAKSAKNLGNAISSKADAALAAAQTAKNKILTGALPLQAMATYKLQKDQVLRNFKIAEAKFKAVHNDWVTGENAIKSAAPTTTAQYASQAAGVFGQTATEFGKKLLTTAQRTGTAAEEFASGASSLVPLAKYLPYALVGLGALYAFQFLPKPRKD